MVVRRRRCWWRCWIVKTFWCDGEFYVHFESVLLMTIDMAARSSEKEG